MQVFEVDDRKAWSAVLLTTCSVLASIALIAYSPWYLLPFAWVFAGTAWTGVSPLAALLSRLTKFCDPKEVLQDCPCQPF